MKNRYIRNMESLTVEENEKLKKLSVCVVGCGGLGGYIIEMLGRIGIGSITGVDGDIFDESNLNRQILCDEKSIGKSKAVKAKERMNLINSEVNFKVISEKLTEDNVIDILKNHDIIVDGLDNIKTRFIIQEVCEKLNIALVHGAISGWFGQVTTILPGDKSLDVIYRNKENEIDNKLGNPSFTPGIVASIQVSEVIKILLNKGEVLSKKLLLIDLLYNEYNIVELKNK